MPAGTVTRVLLTAIATDPTTPAVAVAAIADLLVEQGRDARLGTDPDALAVVLAHPALPDDHPAFTNLGWRHLFYALRSPLITNGRAAHIAAHAEPGARRVHMSLTRTVHPAVLAFDPGEPISPADAEQLIAYPDTPADVVFAALRSLVVDRRYSRDNRGAILSAATRNSAHLLELAGQSCDPQLTRELTVYTAYPDPYQAHVEAVIADSLASDQGDAWHTALQNCPDLQVAQAALRARPTSAVWNIALGSRLPLQDKLHLLRTLPTATWDERPLDPTADFLRETARTATHDDLVELLTSDVFDGSFHLAVLDCTDLTPDVMRVLAARLGDSTAPGARRLNALALVALAIHPCATPDQRRDAYRRARQVAEAASDDLGSELMTIARAGLELTDTPAADVGAQLPVALLWAGAMNVPGLPLLIHAALIAHHDDLTHPEYVHALLALEGDFTGTIGQLLTTARAIIR